MNRDDFAHILGGYSPKLVPPIAVQEADAEALTLPGAANVTTDLNAESGTAGASVTPEPPDHVDAQGGDSQQVQSQPTKVRTGDSETHEHYWIHTVTENIERGNAEFVSFTMPLPSGVPIRLFGLNDLRTRATVNIVVLDQSVPVLGAGLKVYFGDRDMIEGSAPQVAFQIGLIGTHEYRSRKEAFIVNTEPDSGDGAKVVSVTVMEYTSERSEDVLGAKKAAGKS